MKELKFDDVARIKKKKIAAGGKGFNVARFLIRYGENVKPIGIVGGFNGTTFKKLLTESRISTEYLLDIPVETRENHNFFFEDGTVLRFNEAGPVIPEKFKSKILNFIVDRDFKSVSWIFFCGSLPPGIPADFYSQAINKIRNKDTRIMIGLDSDGYYLKSAVNAIPDLIKPNISELERLMSRKITNMGQLRNAAEKLLESGISFVLVTMGSNGTAGFSREGFFYARGPTIKKAGSVGCGDVFLAGFVLSFSKTGKFKESLRFATASGTAKATKPFTEIPRICEVEKILRKTFITNFDDLDEKIEISNLHQLPVQELT
ncbi:MAG: hexose kinase [Candidatus Omnitrophica bacterium]|nr:hexose kinase [Candidatus Omnitrophota bacterium]